MAVTIGLWCVAALFAVSLLTLVRGPFGTAFVYGATLVISLVALALGLTELIGARVSTVALPLGLPILDGAHFRIDALTAFFLTVVNLGGATTSLYAIGYGRSWCSPTTRSRSWCPGNSCRCRRGRWSWRTTASATTSAPATSI